MLFKNLKHGHPIYAGRLQGHTPHALLNQPLPISRRSAVKHPSRRTGSGSRSGLMATQCSLPPTSIPAASGCTISSAFQSTFFWTDLFCLPVGFFALMLSPISIRDAGLGPVPIRKKETLQRGQIRSRKTAADRQTNPEIG